ncbi:class I SAM-dependent methyltransferase [Streptomyces sp. Je 1-4]|uniref:class I SAM-dependent methyltransferase n=1 Tax=Streptomyces TaxID=1883 RepID=UPI0021D86257|nr:MULTISPECIES: class I SAM-dependent methyltransferase [unclassified Streptomyces]UYB41787.1 class I SAM-dependent methyltransferase [Streptomyces sp. Je 1-4]UZQ38049.1 class I SAM-dependent methyltransferase [Streptomyces sp. Je 1-4] [Streptomyces sp. Je 1-4 4N24]UZQ45466.1 class I SAM-dependent methyltransferase [Streptomyces sp. Je 1-4] [Streptomyces sp. Je 1-4 4N24_ara]
MNALDTFSTLLTPEGQALLAELRDHDPADELAAATRLRREHPAELVSAALGQARLRQRAVAKFGADAWRMYFTPNGVEQSTRATVATHRATRLAALGVRTLADLCCGIGGDALALARAGIRVLAVDRDPLACAAARANAEALGLAELIEVRCADVTEVDVAGYDAVFVDPARRSKARGGRIFDPEAYAPPLSWAVEAARKAPVAALKIAPGVPHEALPEDAETEWISDGGDVKEAVVWFGTGEGGAPRPVPGGRRATLLPAGDSLLGTGLPDPAAGDDAPHAPVGPVGDWLYEPDGAVIRAHLVADVARQVGGRLIDPTIAYITADRLTATPYATAYAITDVLPFHVKKLKALLREREVGIAVIKKRGSAVEPEELRKKLKLGGGRRSCTIFLTRVGGAPSMLLGHPATDPLTPGR